MANNPGKSRFSANWRQWVPTSCLLLSFYFPGYLAFNNRKILALNADLLYVLIALVLVSAGVGIFLNWIFKQFAREKTNSELVAFIVLTFIVEYELVQQPLPEMRHRYSILILAVVVFAVSWSILRTRRSLEGVTKFCSVVLVTGILISTAGFVSGNASVLVKAPPARTTASEIRKGKKLPDIYYLIFDSYASEANLNYFFDFDNRQFLEALKSLGFHITQDAMSNYGTTASSLSSILGGVHLESEKRNTEVKLIYEAPALEKFKRLGYSVVSPLSQAYHDSLYRLKAADRILECPALTPFGRLAAQNTLAYPFLYRFDWEARMRKKNAECMFEKISNDESASPNLYFAYFDPLHEEHSMDIDGKLVPLKVRVQKRKTREGIKKLYLDEMQYINKKILSMLSKILERSSDAFIIIHGDHGTRLALDWEHGFEDPTPAHLKERLGILLAARFPTESPPYPESPIEGLDMIYSILTKTPHQPRPMRHFLGRKEVTEIVQRLRSLSR